jgi:eukaryotic-like serine/threonine-protein kinase
MVSGSSLAEPLKDSESRPLPPLPDVGSVSDLPRLSGSETVINKSGPQAMLLPPDSNSPSRQILDRLFPPSHQDSGSSIGTHSPSGIELDHFRIEERIGMGGMGAVFRAVDTRLQRMVALKLLAPTQAYDEGSVKRFQNEARAAARLDHENVARVHYIGEEQGLHFIAFEFVTGSTIRELIRRQHRISVADSINYALQIAAALKHTSAMGVVHRDIKPSNIIITPSGRAKLVDLGLARNDTTESQGDLTLPGTTLGTFDYISPEQAKDPRSVDVRSDIYSLGCTLYHMLTGQPPYPEGTVLQKLLDHQGKDAPDPASINRRIPDFVSAIVRRMMNSDRNNRHQNADQLIRDLTHAAGHLGLRGINPEGLVWVASKSAGSGWLAGNAGWIATVAVLLGVVGVLHQFPEIGLRLAGVPPEEISLANNSTTDLESEIARQSSTGTLVASSTIGSASSGLSTGSKKTATSATDPRETGLPAEISTSEDTLTGHPDLLDPLNMLQISPLVGQDIIGPGGRELIPGMSELLSAKGSVPDPSTPRPPRIASVPEVRPAAQPPIADTPSPTVVPAANPLPVALFTGDASLDRHYRTLEAACAAAEDGSTIELQFSDTLIEKSFRVTRKNLTIRAARGHTPTIEFVPSEIDSTDSTARMITLHSGPLRLVNVNLRMTIPDRPTADRYSLFGMSRPGLLAMDRVAVTVVNPGRAPATIVDVGVDFGRMPADMPTTPVSVPREDLGIQTTDCVFRGQTNFADLSWPGHTVFSISNCAAALDGDFFSIQPLAIPSADPPILSFSIEHLSSRLTGSFLRFAGPVSVEAPSIECSVRNSVFSHSGNASFVLSESVISPEDARRMMTWRGERNFFDSVPVFWSLESSDDFLTWEDWQELWQPDGNVGSRNIPIDWIAKSPFDALAESGEPKFDAFQLGPGIIELNPAIQGSTDGSDAGADLSDLPLQSVKKPAVSASPEPAQTPRSTTTNSEPAKPIADKTSTKTTEASPNERSTRSSPE